MVKCLNISWDNYAQHVHKKSFEHKWSQFRSLQCYPLGISLYIVNKAVLSEHHSIMVSFTHIHTHTHSFAAATKLNNNVGLNNPHTLHKKPPGRTT